MTVRSRAGEVLAVTDATFDREVLGADRPVLVDFWARWCPPCHLIAPVLAEIARERSGSLTIRQLNADENTRIPRDFQVMSLPTLILFVDGKPVRTFVGARPKARLLADLDAALSR
jgi:thioredoxin